MDGDLVEMGASDQSQTRRLEAAGQRRADRDHLAELPRVRLIVTSSATWHLSESKWWKRTGLHRHTFREMKGRTSNRNCDVFRKVTLRVPPAPAPRLRPAPHTTPPPPPPAQGADEKKDL